MRILLIRCAMLNFSLLLLSVSLLGSDSIDKEIDVNLMISLVDEVIQSDGYEKLKLFNKIPNESKLNISPSKIIEIFSKYKIKLLTDDGYRFTNVQPLEGLISLARAVDAEDLLLDKLEESISLIKLDDEITGWGKMGYEMSGSSAGIIFDLLLKRNGVEKLKSLDDKLKDSPNLRRMLLNRPSPKGMDLSFIKFWSEKYILENASMKDDLFKRISYSYDNLEGNKRDVVDKFLMDIGILLKK